jgi:hypothetical protein
MATVVLVVCLAGLAYLAVRMLAADRGPDPRARAPEPRPAASPETKTTADVKPGPLDDEQIGLLPPHVRLGHGFLVLGDGAVDRLVLDGLVAGDRGSSRGYFNVPPGPHTLEARRGGQSSTWTLVVKPNQTYVKRLDWNRGGFIDDDDASAARAREQARSGSLLEAKALRPWPRPSLYFVNPATPLVVDGRLCRTDGAFCGVVNLEPGEHKIETPTHTTACALAPESMQVIDFSSGEPELIDPTVANLMVRTLLRRAPREALVTAGELAASPTPAEALRAAAKPGRIFGDQDLEVLDQAFAAWQAGGAVDGYLESLRLHHIADEHITRQSSYFARFAERLVAHIAAAPKLTSTEAVRELRVLAQALQHTRDETLAKHGRTLAARLGGGAPG